MSAADRVAAVILAGGQGRRMGGVDKGLVAYQGRPLVEWALAVLVPQVDELVISANRNPDIYAAYGHRVLPDTLPDYPGPLAGVLAAMQAVDADWLLVVPCDTPHLPGDLAGRLLAAAQQAGVPLAVAADDAELPRLAEFAGTQFHSARWRWDHDLAGETVGVIGSAASAVQFVPEIVKEARQVHLFQRTANWVMPKEDAPFTPEQLAFFAAHPEAVAAARAEIYRRVDEGMTFSDRAAVAELEKSVLTALEVVADPEVRRKLRPQHPYGCKRPLLERLLPGLQPTEPRASDGADYAHHPRRRRHPGRPRTRLRHADLRDGLVNGVPRAVFAIGDVMRGWQNGNLQRYATVIAIGAAAVLWAVLASGGY